MSNTPAFFLIGGSPSTGSSLLRQMLNRHPQLKCLPETHIFNKKELYTDWSLYKEKLLKRSVFGINSIGYHHFVGIDKKEIANTPILNFDKILSNSKNPNHFIKNVFEKICSEQIIAVGEKTPSNATVFTEYLKEGKNRRTIHITRNPYDTVTSLMSRGKRLYESVCLYLYNTCFGLVEFENIRNLTIRYEDLVSNPVEVLTTVAKFLNVEFHDAMIVSKKDSKNETTKLSGWNYDETENVGTSSIGRFALLSSKKKEYVKYYLSALNLAEVDGSLRKVCNILNYEYLEPSETFKIALQLNMNKDLILRQFSNRNFNFKNYPFHIAS